MVLSSCPSPVGLAIKRNQWLHNREIRNHKLRIRGIVTAVLPDAITREIDIDAPPDVVWAIVTEARHLAGWFSDEAEIDLRPGGAMLLTWHGHGAYRARVETVEPPVTFAFRWVLRDGEEPVPGGSTLVVMTLTPTDAGTRLRVVESGFSDLSWPEHERAGYADQNATAGSGSSTNCAPTQRESRLTPRDDADGEDADRLWAALGDPMRLRLLDLLLEHGEATASALATELPITRQGIAKHLQVLQRADLVAHTRRARNPLHRTRRTPRSSAATDGARRLPVGRAPHAGSSGSPKQHTPPRAPPTPTEKQTKHTPASHQHPSRRAPPPALGPATRQSQASPAAFASPPHQWCLVAQRKPARDRHRDRSDRPPGRPLSVERSHGGLPAIAAA